MFVPETKTVTIWEAGTCVQHKANHTIKGIVLSASIYGDNYVVYEVDNGIEVSKFSELVLEPLEKLPKTFSEKIGFS